MNISYNPRLPSYSRSDTPPLKEETWIMRPKEFRSIGTQYEKPKIKKERSRQWKLVDLYNLAIKKHWKESGKDKKAKKKLRKILKDVFTDKKIAWSHIQQTGLDKTMVYLKKMDGKNDKDIKKWSTAIINLWKDKFNMKRIIIKK